MRTVEQLAARRDKFITQIVKNLDLLIGTVNRTPAQSGWYLTAKVDGKSVTRYVRANIRREVKAMPRRHVRVRALLLRLAEVNWKLLQARCRRCGRKVRGRAPDELPGCPIGSAAKAVAVWFRHVIGMSSRKVQRPLTEMFGMALVPASAMQFGHVAAAQGAPIYATLREAVKTTPVAHADETGWREDGRTAWVWFVGTPRQAIFHIARSRSSAVATELLGDHFPGTLVSDDYAGYHAVNPASRQACVSHLVTRAKKLRRLAVPAPARQRFLHVRHGAAVRRLRRRPTTLPSSPSATSSSSGKRPLARAPRKDQKRWPAWFSRSSSRTAIRSPFCAT